MNKLIKPSTGLAIITGDSSAAVISQIIDANHMLKDKFKELTFDLLRCVIKQIQHEQDDTAKSFHISHAKRLLKRATKKDVDPVSLQKRDCILTSVCLLEGDTEKVKRILQRDWMQNFERASVETIQHAINANQSIGEHTAVERLLTLSKTKQHKVESHVECVLCTTQFESQEALAQQLFDTLNGSGLKSYQIKRLRALQSAFDGLFKRTHPLRRYRVDVAVP